MGLDRYRSPAVVGLVALLSLSLGGCADINGKPALKGPKPAATLPAELAAAAGTDLGQYYVTPRSDLSKKDLDGAIADLKSETDLVLVVEDDGRLNITFHGNPTKDRKTEILKQLVAIGTVSEGV